MKYLTASDIYNREIKFKGKYVPLLDLEEEIQFKLLTTRVTALADVLNSSPKFFVFFMFTTKRDYKKNVTQFKDLLEFWGMDLKDKYHFDNHLTFKAGSS